MFFLGLRSFAAGYLVVFIFVFIRYHPDKATGSVELFRQLESAYLVLTDEIARANWERYGNPDGPRATKVGIALPSFIVDSKNGVVVFIAYIAFLAVLIPLVVWYLFVVFY